jgi:Secretion system C-terminal sorting domain
MKKLLLFTGLLFGLVAIAQTVVYANYNGNLVKDLDNQFVYSESFNSGINAYTLNKIDDAGTSTNFLNYTFPSTMTQLSNGGNFDFYNFKNPTYVKGNKAIVRFIQGTNYIQPTTVAHILYDGSNTTVFNMPLASPIISVNSNFILNNNNAFIFDYSRIYETDYTASGTSLIFTSPNAKSSAFGSIECLTVMQNDGGLYWIDNYNATGTLYKRVGGVNTAIYTDTSGVPLALTMYQNKLTKDIYVTNYTAIVANKILVKIDNAGNHTFMTSPPTAFTSSSYGLVNNKLLFSTFVGQLIALDLTTLAVTDVTTPAVIGLSAGKVVTNENGSKGYFLSHSTTDVNSGQSYPYYTDGITVTSLGGSLGTTTIKYGDFCGDNFYLQKANNPTTFLNEIALLTPTNSSTYFPGSPTNTSYEIGISNATGIYTKAQQSVSPFGAPLYKTACSNSLAISENTITNSDIKLYPNPTLGNFNISIDENLVGAKVSVYNVLGQKAKNFSLDGLNTNQNLEKGIYILEIEKEGNKISRKLIVH